MLKICCEELAALAFLSYGARRIAFSSKVFQPTCRASLRLRTLLTLIAFSCMLFVSAAAGQTAHFTYVKSVVPTSTLTGPDGVAVDRQGNIYIADSDNHRVLKETRVQDGSYTESTIGSGLTLPQATAVDGNGNVYIAQITAISSQTMGQVLKETLSNGSYTQTVITSGVFNPTGIAVDANGNVYFAEDDHSLVLKETPSNGSYTESTVASCCSLTPVGVAVDSSGNVYITDTFNNRVLEESPSAGGYVQTVIASSGITNPVGIALDGSNAVYISGSRVLFKETPSSGTFTQSVIGPIPQGSGLAVDGSGSIYVTDSFQNQLVRFMPTSGIFGEVNVGATSLPLTFIFTFDTGGSIGKPAVVTQGVADLDFADAGTGTCDTNGTSYVYSAGDTCTVDVTFTPKEPGARYGAALLKDAAGSVIATGYAQGIGVGPQVNFSPGTQNTLPLGTLDSPAGITVDAQGNLYIVQAVSQNSPENMVIKETRSGSSYTKSIIASGLGLPTGVAVDGAGNLYIADEDDFEVWKATPSLTGYTQSVAFPNLGNVTGVAVDGSGDIYIISDVEGVLKETPNGSGGYLQSTIAGTGPYAIAVDGSGNVYTADFVDDQVSKYTLSSGTYTQSLVASGLGNPTGIAVDGMGSIYVSNEAPNGQIIKETPSDGGYTKSMVASGLYLPTGIAVDGAGNLYISSHANGSPGDGVVEAVDLADPPSLNFAATAFGLTSSDSPLVVTVRNAGNSPLNIPALSSGSNPNVSANFVMDSNGSGACPVIDSEASSPGSLGAAASCALSISFAPMETGTLSGSVVLTDNNLNAGAPGYAAQTILLSGTGVQATPVIDWSPPSTISYGTDLSTVLTATAQSGSTEIPGSFTYTATATGSAAVAVTGATILPVGNYGLEATFTPTNSSDSKSGTASASLVVSQATPTLSLTSSGGSVFLSNPVTFTAAVTANSGSPSGSVSFYDGSTLLKQVDLASGSASYSTSNLSVGTHSITAVYSGDANFLSGTSSAVTTDVQDFSIAFTGSGTVTTAAGGQATFPLTINPVGGTTMPASIALVVSGLPAGTTASFSPDSISAGSGITNVTLKVSTSSTTSANRPQGLFRKGRVTLVFAVMLLPFWGGIRRASRRLNRFGTLLLLVAILSLAGLTGCGGGGNTGGGDGNGGGTSNPPSHTYSLTVTGSSGALSHSTTVTLTIG